MTHASEEQATPSRVVSSCPDSQVIWEIPPADASLIEQMHGMSVADVHEALPPEAEPACLSGALLPISPGQRICGQAVTAYCTPGDSLMSHCALYAAPPGTVLIISNGGARDGAVFGAVMALEASVQGIAGVILDAPIRDVQSIRELRLPVWSSCVSYRRCTKRGGGYVNKSIVCGGATVNSGDVVVADDDGIVCFAAKYLEEVVKHVRKKQHAEVQLHSRIAAGERVFDILELGNTLGFQRPRLG